MSFPPECVIDFEDIGQVEMKILKHHRIGKGSLYSNPIQRRCVGLRHNTILKGN